MSYLAKQITYDANTNRSVLVDPLSSLRTASTRHIIGSFFPGNSADSLIWATTTAAGGTVTYGSAVARLRTNTTANATTKLNTLQIARLLAGGVNYANFSVALGDSGVTNNIRQWGVYDVNNGYYFQLNGTTFKVGSRNAAADTVVTSASFTGTAPVVDTNYHFYEIYYDTSAVYFYQDGVFLNKLSSATGPLTALNSFPLTMENNNSGGSTTDASLYVKEAAVFALMGIRQHNRYNHINTSTGVALKTEPGYLDKVIVNSKGVSGAFIAVYDSNASGGTLIGLIDGSVTVGAIPFDVDFYSGLYAVSVASGADYTVTFN